MEIIISCTSLDETPQPHIHNLCTEQEEMNLSMARCVCVYVAMGVSVFNIEFVSAFWGPLGNSYYPSNADNRETGSCVLSSGHCLMVSLDAH